MLGQTQLYMPAIPATQDVQVTRSWSQARLAKTVRCYWKNNEIRELRGCGLSGGVSAQQAVSSNFSTDKNRETERERERIFFTTFLISDNV